MTKTIETLEQEAKNARDCAIAVFDNENLTSRQKIDYIIIAAVSMITYQFALAEKQQSTCKEPQQ